MRPYGGNSRYGCQTLGWGAISASRRMLSGSPLRGSPKINVNDLARGVSAPEFPDVASVDMNWYAFLKHKLVASQVGGDNLRLNVDQAAKERIVRAQREAALRELPSAMARHLNTGGADASGSPSGAGDFAEYKTVKATLDAADPTRLAKDGGGSGDNLQQPSPIGAQLEGDGRRGYALRSPPVEASGPSLSIAPTSYSDDAIVTPAHIRSMFRESVAARTVANISLRKYIKALNARDYALAVAAFDGCREGGLKIDTDTYTTILDILLSAQQLRAGMELYQVMIRERNPPSTTAYNALMKLCVDRGAIDVALRLYDEMPGKGRSYDKFSHEMAMNAISKQEHPVDWQKAVQIFERATAGAVDADGVSFDASANSNAGDEGSAPAPRRSKRRNLLDSPADDNDPTDYVRSPLSQPLVGGFTAGRQTHQVQATASTYNALMRVYMAMEPFEWRVVYNCYYEMRNSKPKVRITWESYYLVRDAMKRGEASRTRRLITYIDAWIQLTSIGSARFLMGFMTYMTIIGIIKIIFGYFFTGKIERSLDVDANAKTSLPIGHETIPMGYNSKTIGG